MLDLSVNWLTLELINQMERNVMGVKIEHKVLHREWDEASMTLEEFIKFDELYHGNNDDSTDRYSLSPVFVFNNGSVYVDESWGLDDKGRVSTSSYQCGVMSFSEEEGQYLEYCHYSKKRLGRLISIDFTVKDDMRNAINSLSGC